MIALRIGDSRNLILELQDRSIDCVVTSPPYWNLRDYGHPGQIGLEKTPEDYLKTMLDFFDSVYLKLKDDGNCFVNIGDTYNGSGNGNNFIDPKNKVRDLTGQKPKPIRYNGIPKKCLCMIPSRFAWGMIERGWILRNEIIWSKTNHMPESVTDRLTKAHEVIFHFVKQGKYYYNLDAIREPHKEPIRKISSRTERYNEKAKDTRVYGNSNKSLLKYRKDGLPPGHPVGKNPGDVWSIPTTPYPESHFATFPLELVRRPILAGCPVGGTVLDPFAGSGTVGEFCRTHDRNAILFELNPEYKKLIEDRVMLKVLELSIYHEKV